MNRRSRRVIRLRSRSIAGRRGNRKLPRSSFNGIKVRGPMDPRPVNLNPWRSVIIEDIIQNNGTNKPFAYSAADLYLKAAQQLNVPIADLQLRVAKIELWDRVRDLSVVLFYDYLNNLAIARCRDRGTTTRPSHLHFVLPKSTSAHVISNSKDIGVVSGECGEYLNQPISGQSDLVMLQVSAFYRNNEASKLAFFPLKPAVSKTAVKASGSNQAKNGTPTQSTHSTQNVESHVQPITHL